MVLIRQRVGRVGRRHFFLASVAQGLERSAVNRNVVGSNPTERDSILVIC